MGALAHRPKLAVVALQKAHGLTADGIVGPITKGLLLGMESKLAPTPAPAAVKATPKQVAQVAAKAATKATKQPLTKQQSALAKPPKAKAGKGMKLQAPKAIKHTAPAGPAPDLEEQNIAFGWGNQPSRSIMDYRDEEPGYDQPRYSAASGAEAGSPNLPGKRPGR